MAHKIAICNLCSAELPIDDLWVDRKAQHETWHSPRGVTSMLFINNIRGNVKWNYKYV